MGGALAAGVLSGIGAGALWGLVFLAPELTRDFNGGRLSVGRYLIYGLTSAVLLLPRWRDRMRRLTPKDWWVLIGLSLCGNTVYYVLLSAAVHNCGVAVTSLVSSLLPVSVAVIGSRDHAAVPLRRLAPALALCAAGSACIGIQALSGSVPGTAAREAVGLLCAIAGLVLWTCYAVSNSRALARLEPDLVADWNLLLGVVTGLQALLELPLLLAGDAVRHTGADWLRLVSVCAALAWVASMGANALFNRMSRLLPLTLAGPMILFETLFALLYAFLWEQRLPKPA
jgi:drug/metabolite transporter (DMT)-like permease